MDDAFERMANELLAGVNTSRVTILVEKLAKMLNNKEAFEIMVATGMLVAIVSTQAPPDINSKTVLSGIFAVATKFHDRHQAGDFSWMRGVRRH